MRIDDFFQLIDNYSVPITILIILITMAYALYLLKRQQKIFKSFNQSPPIKIPSQKKQNALEVYPVPIQAGLLIRNFLEFNPEEKKFSFNGYVWFTFNPSLLSLQSLSEFTFERAEIAKTDPETCILPNGNLIARYGIHVEFSQDLDFRNFPLDDHRIFLVLYLPGFAKNAISFQVFREDFIVDTSSITGWQLINQQTLCGVRQIASEKKETLLPFRFPCVLFSFDFIKIGIRKPATVFMPVVLLFFTGYVSLILPIQTLQQALTALAISAAGLTGLMTYRFVLETLTPQTSYFTASDRLYALFLMGSFVVFTLNLFHADETENHLFLDVKYIFFILIPFFMMFGLYWINRKMLDDKI